LPPVTGIVLPDVVIVVTPVIAVAQCPGLRERAKEYSRKYRFSVLVSAAV
jgi:uncharacterized membrane protein